MNKPSTPQRNSDRSAGQLGVPQSNVLDLRGFVHQEAVVSTDQPVPLEPKAVEPVQQLQQLEPQAQPIPESAKLPIPQVVRKTRNFSWRGIVKPTLGFAVWACVMLLPASGIAMWQHAEGAAGGIAALAAQAASQFKLGANSASQFQFSDAKDSFNAAQTDFASAREQLNSINSTFAPLLESLPSEHNTYVSAQNVLVAGEQLSAAGKDVSSSFDLLSALGNHTDALAPADLLVAAHSALRPVAPRLERATIALQEVDVTTLPTEYQAPLTLAQQQLPLIKQSMTDVLSMTETLIALLGHDKPKRYLVLFQNNRELRATGGFIGSYALVDIDNGRVSRIEIPGGGPYDLQGSLTEKVISPEPLHLVNSKWQLQDANWWPDFPTSAKKIEWFYEHSGGPSVDGVITLTPDIIELMLAQTGPIEMPEYNQTVTADNFYEITQTEAERKFDDTRESKKFIADLTPKLLDKLFTIDASSFLPMLQVLYTGLQEKQILLYSNDVFLQGELSRLGWAGELRQTSGDYLMVVDTNIAGGKTDAAIDQTIEHQANIQPDGSVIDTVTITKVHNGESGDIFADAKNLDYMRIYVPEGSAVLSAEGFTQPNLNAFLPVPNGYTADQDLIDISGETVIDAVTGMRVNTEFGKTVLAGWVETAPGESSHIVVRYRLPFKANQRYSLLVQKQPGAFNPTPFTEVNYPAAYQAIWQYPYTGLTQRQILKDDAFVGVVFN